MLHRERIKNALYLNRSTLALRVATNEEVEDMRLANKKFGLGSSIQKSIWLSRRKAGRRASQRVHLTRRQRPWFV